MPFLNTLDQLSYKKIFSIAIFLSVLFTVPVVMFLLNQQTRLSSRAAYEKPSVAQTPKATPGPIPNEPPKIGRAFPWVGKVGDIIWIQGWNFGINPESKKLIIGGVVVEENDIAAWEDDLIQAVIPEGAMQGGTVEVKIGSYSTSRSLPIVLFDKDVKVRMHKDGNMISLKNASGLDKAIVWTGDDEIATEKKVLSDINVSNSGEVELFDTEGLPILTILLIDKDGNIMPYAADPIEFDF